MTTDVYAYWFDDTTRIEAIRAERRAEDQHDPHDDCPVTGWMHRGDGPPWLVIAGPQSELELLKVPHARIVPYTGDEPTVAFRDWVPDGFVERQRARLAREADPSPKGGDTMTDADQTPTFDEWAGIDILNAINRGTGAASVPSRRAQGPGQIAASALRAYANRWHGTTEGVSQRTDYGTGIEHDAVCQCGSSVGEDGCSEREQLLADAFALEQSSPQHAVIAAAIAWRKVWAGATTVLAKPEVRALIDAVDALPRNDNPANPSTE